MPEQQGETQSVTQTDNWKSLESSFGPDAGSGAVATTTNTQTEQTGGQSAGTGENQAQTQNTGEQTQGQEQTQQTGDNTQQTSDDAAKTGEATQQEPPALTLTADDVKKDDLPAETGTWLKRFQDQKLPVPTDFAEDKGPEIFVEALKKDAEAKIQEAHNIGVEKLLSTLKPETATKIKLMEMGLTEEQIFQPTRVLDGYIAMEDAALARAEYVAQGYPEDVVEAKMEALAADPTKLTTFVNEIRFNLNREKQGIQSQHETLVQQYEAQKAQVLAAQQQEKVSQFSKVLDTVSDFMGVPIAKEAKELVLRKYQSGAYKESLGTPSSEVELVLYREFGKKIASSLTNTAFEKGRDEIKKNLSNIPPVKANAGQRQVTRNDSGDNWAALDRMFGNT